ncbi:hypothetical protein HQ560_21625 [bacterium]|nr:hypothetical protein [bacterium]
MRALALLALLSLPTFSADAPETLPADKQIREQIPRAASMSANAFRRIVQGAAMPRLDQFENQSLTAFLLCYDFTKAKPTQQHVRWLKTDGIRPDALANEVARPVPKLLAALAPPPTLIHADRIEWLSCYVKGDKATGAIHFGVPDLFEGNVQYVAARQGKAWKITTFLLPGYNIRLALTDKGLWRREGLDPAARNAKTVTNIRVDYAVHFTNLLIRIDDEKVDYDLRLQGPGRYYELPSSPAILEALSAPLLSSKLFKQPPKEYAERPDSIYGLTIQFADGVMVSRAVPHEYVHRRGLYPTIRMWLGESRGEFSGLLSKNPKPE